METFKINTTASKIQLACSKDYLRPQFHYVYFKREADVLEFCATDAHVMIYGNFAGFIGEEAAAALPDEFYMHADQYKKLTNKKVDLIKIDNEASRIYCLDKNFNEIDSLLFITPAELMQKKGVKFPNWKVVLPQSTEPIEAIGFDSDVLSRALEAMTVPGLPSFLRYDFSSNGRGCRLSHTNEALNFIRGLVMPCKIG